MLPCMAVNLDEPPAAAQRPFDAISEHVKIRDSEMGAGFYGINRLGVDTTGVDLVGVGLTVIERYGKRSGSLGLNDTIDDLVGRPIEERHDKAYDMDAVIAATAMEIAYLRLERDDQSLGARVRRTARSLRIAANLSLPHLTKLKSRDPFANIGRKAIVTARESLIDEYVAKGKLSEAENVFFCAQMIGIVIDSALRSVDEAQEA